MAANVLRLTETGQLIIRPSAFQNQWIRWLGIFFCLIKSIDYINP
jgi:hypothetical protein